MNDPAQNIDHASIRGLILNGNALINGCDLTKTVFCEANGEGGTGSYGGKDAKDNSGVLTYVRIEFAGELISPDNELNGITFQGVGSGTMVDFVQVHVLIDRGHGSGHDLPHRDLTRISP